MAFTNIAKDINEKLVMEVMRDLVPHSKQEVVRKTGLSFPTVSKLMDELTEDGKFLLLGTDESSKGGRKAKVYCLNNEYAHVLTLFVQGRMLFWNSFDAFGKGIASGTYTLICSENIREGIKRLIEECLLRDALIRVVSLGVPGSVRNGKVCYIDGYDDLKDCDLQRELCQTIWTGSDGTQLAGLRFCVYNNMRAVAEGMAFRDSEKQNIACIHLAETGPGCSAVVNGQPLEGFCGFNGEVGFIPFYGEKTLQEIALGGFSGVSPGEYLGKIAICLCTVLNPARLVLYIEKDWEREDVDRELKEYLIRFLPEEVLPEFQFSDDYRQDYQLGLIRIGLEEIFG